MNIRWLKIFQTVAQEESMSAAAKRLFVSQPAVSQSIADLEEKLGVELFDRVSGQVKLNSVGEVFLQRVNPLLEQFENLENSIEELALYSTISVGSTITSATFLLPQLLEIFQADYPHIQVQVTVKNAEQLELALIRGEMDIGFLEGVVVNPILKKIPLLPFQLSFFCAPHHPFANKKDIALEQLKTEPVFLREKGSAVRETFDSALLLREKTISPAWTSVNSGVLVAGVKRGLGVSILPKQLLKNDIKSGDICLFSVQEFALSCPSQIAYHKQKQLSEPIEQLIHISRMLDRSLHKQQ